MPHRPTPATAQDANRRQALSIVFTAILLVSALTLSGCTSISTGAPASNPAVSASSSNLTISSALPSATVGTGYSAKLGVSGGTAPYGFSIQSGQLPAGVQLTGSTGAFSGTPSAAGIFSFAISVVDATGSSKQQSLQLSVLNETTSSGGNGSSGGTGSNGGSGTNGGSNSGELANSFPNLQKSAGWASAGQGPPDFVDCSPSPCDGIAFSFQQGISSPSMSGSAAQYNLGGTAVYTDALFNNHLIGVLSSQGLPDNNHSLVPSYHSFTYDVYFYGTNLELSQAVEFDINQFFNSQGFIWGHECRIAGGNEWDIWDNVNAHWVPTGIACNPVSNQWNHVTIQVQRTASNQLLYESISLNGVTSQVNDTYAPGAAPSNWYGITINYQMDGNYQQSAYSVYLDDLTFWYQ